MAFSQSIVRSVGHDDGTDHAFLGGAVDRAVVAVDTGLVEGGRVDVARGESVGLHPPRVTRDRQHVVVVATLVLPHDLGARLHLDVGHPEGVVECADLHLGPVHHRAVGEPVVVGVGGTPTGEPATVPAAAATR